MNRELEIYAAEFDRCAPFIAPALDVLEWWERPTIDEVKSACLRGDMQLWPAENSALVTEIKSTPRVKYCVAVYGGGDLDELKGMAPKIMQWAKEKGCAVVCVEGRKGWVRALGIGRIVSTRAVEYI